MLQFMGSQGVGHPHGGEHLVPVWGAHSVCQALAEEGETKKDLREAGALVDDS